MQRVGAENKKKNEKIKQKSKFIWASVYQEFRSTAHLLYGSNFIRKLLALRLRVYPITTVNKRYNKNQKDK